MTEKLKKLIKELINKSQENLIDYDREENEYKCTCCGQSRGIECMIEHNSDCIDTLIENIYSEMKCDI